MNAAALGACALLFAGCATCPTPTAPPAEPRHPLAARARPWRGDPRPPPEPCAVSPQIVICICDLGVTVTARCPTTGVRDVVVLGRECTTAEPDLWVTTGTSARSLDDLADFLARGQHTLGRPGGGVVLTGPVPTEFNPRVLDRVEQAGGRALVLQTVSAGDTARAGTIHVEVVDVVPDRRVPEDWRAPADHLVARVRVGSSRMLFLGAVDAVAQRELVERRCTEVMSGRCDALAADLLVVTVDCLVDMDPVFLERVRPSMLVRRRSTGYWGHCAEGPENAEELDRMHVQVIEVRGSHPVDVVPQAEGGFSSRAR